MFNLFNFCQNYWTYCTCKSVLPVLHAYHSFTVTQYLNSDYYFRVRTCLRYRLCTFALSSVHVSGNVCAVCTFALSSVHINKLLYCLCLYMFAVSSVHICPIVRTCLWFRSYIFTLSSVHVYGFVCTCLRFYLYMFAVSSANIF